MVTGTTMNHYSKVSTSRPSTSPRVVLVIALLTTLCPSEVNVTMHDANSWWESISLYAVSQVQSLIAFRLWQLQAPLISYISQFLCMPCIAISCSLAKHYADEMQLICISSVRVMAGSAMKLLVMIIMSFQVQLLSAQHVTLSAHGLRCQNGHKAWACWWTTLVVKQCIVMPQVI